MRTSLLLCVFLFILPACGKRGDLYRPDSPAQTVGEESVTNDKKKSRIAPPAPQAQKVPTESAPAEAP